MTEQIDTLDIKDGWKKRFKLINSLGVDDNTSRDKLMKTEKYKQLSHKEKRCINNNYWALFGGFIYYFIKGMPYKACVIMLFTIIWGMLLNIFDFCFGLSVPDVVYWVPAGVACMILANFDYYKKVLFNEIMWPLMPALFHNKKMTLLLAAMSFTLNIFMAFYMANNEYATQAALSVKNPTLVHCGMYNIYALDTEISEFGEDVLCALVQP